MDRDTRKTLDFVMAAIRTLGSLAMIIWNIYMYFHFLKH